MMIKSSSVSWRVIKLNACCARMVMLSPFGIECTTLLNVSTWRSFQINNDTGLKKGSMFSEISSLIPRKICVEEILIFITLKVNAFVHQTTWNQGTIAAKRFPKSRYFSTNFTHV